MAPFSNLNGLTVHKFGGSSLQSAQHYRQIFGLLAQQSELVVLPASANTTS